nr:MAG TPA: hypothetical protein [Caudoviricetes sp.]
MKIRKSIKRNLRVRVARLNKRMKIRRVSKAKYRQGVASWWGWLKYSDSKHLFKQFQKLFPYEINFKR